MIKHIFITGMTGSIGSWFARQFLERGHRVTALVRGRDKAEAANKVARTLEIVEASDFADRVTVLRSGRVVDHVERDGMTPGRLLDLMAPQGV